MTAGPDTTDISASAVGTPEGVNQEKGQNQMTRENTVRGIYGHGFDHSCGGFSALKVDGTTYSSEQIRAALSAAPLHEGEGEDWSELERLARSAIAVCKDDEEDWYRREHFPQLEVDDAAFIAAANPATILKLIASARSAPSPSVEVSDRLRMALLGLLDAVEQHDMEEGAALSRKQEPGVPTPGGEG
jgi:hypothetical protein